MYINVKCSSSNWAQYSSISLSPRVAHKWALSIISCAQIGTSHPPWWYFFLYAPARRCVVDYSRPMLLYWCGIPINDYTLLHLLFPQNTLRTHGCLFHKFSTQIRSNCVYTAYNWEINSTNIAVYANFVSFANGKMSFELNTMYDKEGEYRIGSKWWNMNKWMAAKWQSLRLKTTRNKNDEIM